MKVVIVTTPTASNLATNMQLQLIPWNIMQLQSLKPDEKTWGDVYKVLLTDIDNQKKQTPQTQRCMGKLVYNSMQEDMSRRTLKTPDLLQGYTISRVDDEQTGGVRPQSVIDRERIPYNVFKGRPDDLHKQPIQVFIERLVPKKLALGQRLHSESGLAKTATLLSAVGEWRTWIVLGESS